LILSDFCVCRYADVLIAGTSGFSRLAAALAKGGMQLAPTIASHSLNDVSNNIVQIKEGDYWWRHFVTDTAPEEAMAAFDAAAKLSTTGEGLAVAKAARAVIAGQPHRFPVGCLHE